MNDLIKAAKAVINRWDLIKPDQVPGYIKELHSAVERAETAQGDFDSYWQEQEHAPCHRGAAELIWTAAQQAERERIRDIIKCYADGGWTRCCNQILEKIDND